MNRGDYKSGRRVMELDDGYTARQQSDGLSGGHCELG
jgi:hypothetical protein